MCGGEAAEVAHQLHAGLDDVGHRAEFTSVDNAVVALVRLGEVRELAGGSPVEFAAVDDNAAALYRVAVHVFGGGVDDDVCAPLERAAEDRRCERVVHDERNVVPVRDIRPLFDVEYGQSRVGERFTENSLGVRLEQLLDLLFIRFRVRPDALDAELFEGDAEQVDRAAVDGGDGDEAVACGAEVEDGEQGSGLTRGGQHGADAALESGDLLFHGVAGRVSEAGVDALGRHIKQGRDLCGRVEAVGGGLNDGHDAGAAVFRLVAFMQAFCFDLHNKLPFL